MSEIRSMIAGFLQCRPDDIATTAALGETPGWDSFTQLNIMLELERRFAIPITDETIRTYSRFAAIDALAQKSASS